jgi:hypothetical protein
MTDWWIVGLDTLLAPLRASEYLMHDFNMWDVLVNLPNFHVLR